MTRPWNTHLLRTALTGCLCLLLSACASTPAADARPSNAARSYAFWPLFPADPRIQFLRSFGSSDDLAPRKASGLESIVFGKEVTQEAMINKPYGLTMKGGKIYVCDMRAGSLVVLDLLKKQTRLVGVAGSGRLTHPVAVAIADDGMIYVAESDRGAIIVFDARERYSYSMGFQKFKPVSLALHGDRLYACDMAGQVVQIFDRKSGSHLGSIGSVGDEDGQFRLPLGVATDAEGNVYAVDMMRGRVQKFSPDGRFIAGVGTIGDTPGTFARPKHIAVDADGIVYVVDAAFQNVQMFDDQLRLLMAFGAAGDFPGSMNLPAGICVVEDGAQLFADALHPGFAATRLVAVTNQFGSAKVSVYALGQAREGYTAADLAKSAAKVSPGTGATPDTLQLQELGQEPEPTPAPAPEVQPTAPPVSPK
ncbi:hypothetical protein PHYC_00719 [Phycisphaerales bacterium]|nr:hypothetical protein PHYC_00719 [Phycisphaerales bacterium]